MFGILFWLCVGSIVYTYAGYPLLLTLFARMRPQPQPYAAATPSVTLLIAAYNEATVIAAKLENSLQLDYPRDRLQILVAADGSDDLTASIVSAYADRGVDLSYSPRRRGKMVAINHAMSQVHGDIIVFSDANNSYDTNVLRELVAPFADLTVGAVSGSKSIVRGDGTLGEAEGLYWKYETFLKTQETRLGCCISVAGEVLAMRRSLFEFPPDHIINDDLYMALRLIRRGYRIVSRPQARSVERISLSPQDEITRRARIVAGRYQVIGLAHKLLPLHRPIIVWQIVSHKFLRPLVPLAMSGALLTNLLAVSQLSTTTDHPWVHLGPPVNWILLMLQVLFYVLASLGNGIKHTDTVGKLLYLPTFLVNSNLAALTGLYHFLTQQHTPLWHRVKRRESHPYTASDSKHSSKEKPVAVGQTEEDG